MKYYQIALEGIDKTGKDTIREYIFFLGKAKYICRTRGLISAIVYSKLFNRGYEYDTSAQPNVVYIHLVADKEDWQIRCKMTNEKEIDYDTHSKVFAEVCNQFRQQGSIVLKYNTSKQTAYKIAKDIIRVMEELNGE